MRGNLGLLQLETGRYRRSRRSLRRALFVNRRVGSRRVEAINLSNLALVLYETGRLDRANLLLGHARHLQEELGDESNLGRTLANLAALELERGATPRACELFEQALRIHRRLGNRRSEAIALTNLAILESLTGSARSALEYGERALAIHREVRNRRLEAFTLANLGAVQRWSGDVDAALASHEAALALHEELGDDRLGTTTRINLASILSSAGERERALELLAAALEFSRDAGEPRLSSGSLCVRALLWLDRGERDRALEDARRAVELIEPTGEALLIGEARGALARCLAETGSTREAEESFAAAIEHLERWLREVGPEIRRAELIERAYPLFEAVVGFLLRPAPAPDARRIARAFDVAERAKGRALLETICSGSRGSAVPGPDAERLESVEHRLRALQDRLLRARAGESSRADVVRTLEGEQTRLRREHAGLVEAVELRYPVYAAEQGLVPPLPLAEARERVASNPETALLEYFVTSEETYLWVARRDRVRSFRLGAGREDLEERVREVLRPFRLFRERPSPHALLALSPRLLRDLAELLVGPALPWLRGVRRLAVAPSGPLHGFPLEMLVLRLPGEEGWTPATADRPFDAPEYLAERFELVYGPSASLLDSRLTPAVDARATLEVLALGDPEPYPPDPASPDRRAAQAFPPLPGAHEEIEHLRRLEGLGPVRGLTGREAGEAAYRAHAPEADLVHLGCHSLLDDEDPAYSGVVLAAGDGGAEDALLQAFEIARVPLERRPL
ncbi:MAG: tetratricopeptide repeat protein, partial [Planctomycetota bacterium]|nr:tetratricopeptide repeat protein [Planctomycetota bacterium]